MCVSLSFFPLSARDWRQERSLQLGCRASAVLNSYGYIFWSVWDAGRGDELAVLWDVDAKGIYFRGIEIGWGCLARECGKLLEL